MFSNSMFGTVRARARRRADRYSPSDRNLLHRHAATGAEGHAVLVLALTAGAFCGACGKRQDHVRNRAVGGVERHGLDIADSMQRQRACGRHGLVEERWREAEGSGVGIETFLQLICRQVRSR